MATIIQLIGIEGILYLLWIAFATVLHSSITWLNRKLK